MDDHISNPNLNPH